MWDKSARILVRVRLVEKEVIPVASKLNREVAGHADILATILARKSARMSVSAPWNAYLPLVTASYMYNRCHRFLYRRHD